MQLELTNVINISVSAAQAGIGDYNTSNLAVFTDEIPAMSFGSLGYSLYLDPSQVGVDFGTSSKTFAMANAIFSQQPNILAGGGYLAVILLTVESQTLTFSAAPASGTFVFNYGGHASAAINWNDTAAMVQAKLQAMPGLSEVLVTGSIAGELLTVQFAGVYGLLSLATITSNTLNGSITITVAQSVAGETWGAAVTRTKDLIQYFGCMVNQTCAEIGQTDLLAAAAIIQPLNKIGFAVSHTEADIQSGGMIDMLRTGDFTQMRGLYYGDSVALNDIVMMASYAGRALSTDFSGSNTTQTMHLKDLIGVQPDPTMTQTILNEALLAGADTYVSLQGVAKVFCSGANKFFDQAYNLQWFVGALQVAGFNYLAESSTKIPQTESGVDGLKGAYRNICEQGITNQYGAPGQWNSSTTFGNQKDFLANISQRGYYIFSIPISQQSQTDRAARKAPLVQIAFKEAGAIQKSSVIVYVNA
jgi:hypothetical protein